VKFSPWEQSSPTWTIHTLILSEEIEEAMTVYRNCMLAFRRVGMIYSVPFV